MDNTPICPACGSQTISFSHTFNSYEAAKHLSSEKQKLSELRLHIESLWGRDKCSYYVCDACTLFFAHPFIAGDGKFYEIVYSIPDSYPNWKWEFQITYEKLIHIRKQKDISDSYLLEIGAGKGVFVDKISLNIIKKENILCTEYSQVGKRKILDFGVNCLDTEITINKYPQLKNKFDYVCMFQVLEHLSNLDSFFITINDITKKDATLFIGVPNNLHREFFERNGLFEDFPPTHITRWNYISLSEFAKKYNWVIIDHQREPMSYFAKINKFLHLLLLDSLFSKIYFISNRKIRNILKLLPFFFFSLIKLSVILKLRNKELGSVQWFQLNKIKL